jgi:two-component system, cell cycle sensor histidine kinase and response regulator CckA
MSGRRTVSRVTGGSSTRAPRDIHEPRAASRDDPRWGDLPPNLDAGTAYRLLAENASDVVVLGSNAGVMEWVSPSVTELIGWRPDEMAGRAFAEFVNPADLPAVRAVQAGLLRGERQRFEARLRCRDEEWRWVSVAMRPLFDAAGNITGRVGALRDADAEIRAREAVTVSEARFRAVLDHSSVSITILRPILDGSGAIADAEILFANQPARSLYFGGVASEQSSGRRLFEAVPWARELVLPIYERVLQSGGAVRETIHGYRDDGEFWSSVTAFPIEGGFVHIGRDITAEMRTNEALRQSETRFEAAVESLLDPLVILQAVRDGAGRIVDFAYTYANDAACRYNHLTRDAHIGRRLLELLPAHESAGLLDAYARVVETGEPLVLDGLEYADRWGGVEQSRIFDVRAHRLGGDSLVYTWRDVTEQRQAQGRLTATLDTLLDPLIIMRAVRDENARVIDFSIEFTNAAATRRGGLSAEAMAGRSFLQVRRGHSPAGMFERYVQVMETGEPLVLDGLRHMDASVGDTSELYFDFRGHRVGELIVVTWRDVSERNESETRFRRTLDGLMEGVAIFDRDLRYTYVNDAFAAQARFQKDELLGRTIQEAYPGVETTPFFVAYRRAMTDGIARSLEEAFTFEDGASGWFEQRIEPIAEGLFLLSMDRTDRHLAEEALRRAEGERLEAISRLAGGVAHEFNNMLQAINLTAEYLAETTPESDPRHEDLDTIRGVGERAAAITAELLAFGRRQFMQPTAIALGEFLGDMAPQLRRTVGPAIALRLEINPGLSPVLVDRHRLEQIVLNLALNALHRMPKGGSLAISAAHGEIDAAAAEHRGIRPGSYVRLTVSDTGPALDAVRLGRIFEPFPADDLLDGGAGLALAAIEGIVVQSGGSIDAADEPGPGVTFTIHLPCAAGCGGEGAGARA